MKNIALAGAASLLPTPMFSAGATAADNASARKRIQAFCIDFNWTGGKFAKPGHWADASPQEHIQWYKDLGCNAAHSFCVSCNGYAWYRSGFAPEQPGLRHDFLTEMVRLGHKANMEVFGYFCIGANSLWGQTHPEESYGAPTHPHIPLTNRYLDYLCNSVEDALRRAGPDGLHLDWLWNPQFLGAGKPLCKWLKCEREMYKELMNENFPDAEKVLPEQFALFRKRAINRCWERLYERVRSVSKKCILWLTCNNLAGTDIQGAPFFRQLDQLLGEDGGIAALKKSAKQVGKQTRLLTCLAAWNGRDPVKTVNEVLSSEIDIGLYGFAAPTRGDLCPPVRGYLEKPISVFRGNDRNIATYARAFNGLSLDYIAKPA
ncbi:MAG: hypothetical protein LBT53_04785 [Puniceicoccales bacterium]|nr:hypothetical protein [Puniceicoccales bacterium]